MYKAGTRSAGDVRDRLEDAEGDDQGVIRERERGCCK